MKYINKTLTIEKTNLQKIANKFGTPFYSYSYSKLKENIKNFKKNFRSFSPLICFAVKSNTNVNIIREIKLYKINNDLVNYENDTLENSLSFSTWKNKVTDLTEFYNLIYQYKNDCLTAAIEYNKDYYSDRALKADESIFFKLTIIPFGETKSPNLKKWKYIRLYS